MRLTSCPATRVRGRAAAAGGVAVLGALTGCTAAVVVEPAPSASDPACGVVLLLAPEVLDGRERRTTTSQSSRAWGATEPVVLRCGVEPPGPSPDRCVRVTDPQGGSVDWLVREGTDVWTFTTYGREPAVEVTVPVDSPADGVRASAVLTDLGTAVGATTVRRTCL